MNERDDPRGVSRVEQLELIDRLNRYEHAIPIYRQALEAIADAEGSGPWGRVAARALRDALVRPR